ncbi:hypothetical protein [Rhodopseudomonas sp. AAP120]|uniref:hypothetical protein n=1 Tax=Rhodopseudomonas sp. AAP120 TaxID=1523430 RepID=UPI0018D0EF3E|nr:hypothetical protein [Rhodopseudomonas sp. AAP120]
MIATTAKLRAMAGVNLGSCGARMAAVTHATGYVPINPTDGNPPFRGFKALHALLSRPSITDIRAGELIAPITQPITAMSQRDRQCRRDLTTRTKYEQN